MKRLANICLSGALLVGAGVPAVSGTAAAAQSGDHGRYDNGYRNTHPYDDRYDRGQYGDRDNNDRRYNNGDYRRDNRGGIGPGKGALIGGGGGALLGGLLGGGLKGALIGGGIGAGGGALLGKANQNRRERNYRDNRDYRERYDQNGRPY